MTHRLRSTRPCAARNGAPATQSSDVDEGRSPTLEIGQLEATSCADCVAQAISDGIVRTLARRALAQAPARCIDRGVGTLGCQAAVSGEETERVQLGER